MNYQEKFPTWDVKSVLKYYAHTKRDVVKNYGTDKQYPHWEDVPSIDETSKPRDIVKDFSVDSTIGHVGIVDFVEHFTKRDGRKAVRIHFNFINHSTVDSYPDIKTRKLEFIINA